jgi:hypothetical protein
LAIASLQIFLPGSRPYGRSYAEWSAKWWQWICSIPRTSNPGYDRTGERCECNQNSPVWFLVGTFEEFTYAERRCTIPLGVGVMFPIIASEKSFAEYPQLHTEDELVSLAREANDRVKSAYVEIDGIAVQNIKRFRIRSHPFDLYFPENNVFGVSPGATKSVSDGYWIILCSLARGIHKLRFGGEAYTMDKLEFKTDAMYDLIVK